MFGRKHSPLGIKEADRGKISWVGRMKARWPSMCVGGGGCFVSERVF